MSGPQPSIEDIANEIKSTGAQKIKVAVTDIDGVLRGKFIHVDKFLSAVQSGFGFCSVIFGWDTADQCYDNTTYTGWHSGYPDAEVRLDPATYRHVPWDNNVPFLLGDFRAPNGDALDVCPRQVLKTVVERAHTMGFSPSFGVEYEWFNFRETPHSLAEKGFAAMAPMDPGMFGYSVLRASLQSPYFHAIMDEMAAFGVPVETLHTETGPGVLEAAILYSDALEAADRAVLFKTGVKEIAYRFGIMPSFMAKWNPQLPGCSGHLHQSLWDVDRTRNVFYDETNPHGMTDTFKHYLAGQLQLLPELLPFYAPTVNSYKRLVEGMWAPTSVTWGMDNRTACLRVIAGSPKGTRTETRVTGGDINPYLAIAAALASGLYGIEHKLDLTLPPVKGNAYAVEDAVPLARNLLTATEALAASTVAPEMLGAGFVQHFVESRVWEWRQFQKAVTSWELERYFEII